MRVHPSSHTPQASMLTHFTGKQTPHAYKCTSYSLLTFAYIFFSNTRLPHSGPKGQISSPEGLSDSQHSTLETLGREEEREGLIEWRDDGEVEGEGEGEITE